MIMLQNYNKRDAPRRHHSPGGIPLLTFLHLVSDSHLTSYTRKANVNILRRRCAGKGKSDTVKVVLCHDPKFVELCSSSGCSVARLARLLWEQKVAGSNPATPTLYNLDILSRFIDDAIFLTCSVDD
jgi:hypothetical protein